MKKPTRKSTPDPGAPQKEVIVGSLTDWPLGARMVKLLELPEWATRLGFYQALGNHANAAAEEVFRVPESMSPEVTAIDGRIHAASSVNTCGRAASFKSASGYHANCSAEDLAARLAKSYVVQSPSEALAGRRLTPAQSLGRIAKVAEKASLGIQRKPFMAYLEGGPFRDSLLRVDPHELSKVFVSDPEVFNEVDDRLFTLWVRAASEHTMPPMPPTKPELGFDRFGAWCQKLVAAGVGEKAALDHVLVALAQHSRWWPSTGVWVLEQLVFDAAALISRVLAKNHGETRLADVLTSVLWLPEETLDALAADVVRRVCASPELVPDKTLSKMREDDELAALLAPVDRKIKSAGPAKSKVAVRVAPARKLLELG